MTLRLSPVVVAFLFFLLAPAVLAAPSTDTQGKSIGTFRPDDQINRAEVAKMIALASKLLKK